MLPKQSLCIKLSTFTMYLTTKCYHLVNNCPLIFSCILFPAMWQLILTKVKLCELGFSGFNGINGHLLCWIVALYKNIFCFSFSHLKITSRCFFFLHSACVPQSIIHSFINKLINHWVFKTYSRRGFLLESQPESQSGEICSICSMWRVVAVRLLTSSDKSTKTNKRQTAF